MLRWTVPGRPVGQGSKRHVGGGRMVEMSNVKGWRALAVQIMHDPSRPPIDAACRVGAVFRFARPKSHFRANGELKPDAPFWYPSSPDLDKLCRAVGDALTVAGVIEDDRLIASWEACSVYAAAGGQPSTVIEVEALWRGRGD